MNIAIVGAGIGGLATANALLKQGFNVQVYEQAQALRPIGAGLSLTPNGLNSLNAVQPGIVESLIKAGSLTQTLTLKRSTGEMIASKPIVPSLGQGANTAFEDAYELAECLTAAPNLETALHDYETSRIPRTTAIYDHSATQGRNAYGTASESMFAKLMKTSEISQDDFEAWLYSYNPATPD